MAFHLAIVQQPALSMAEGKNLGVQSACFLESAQPGNFHSDEAQRRHVLSDTKESRFAQNRELLWMSGRQPPQLQCYETAEHSSTDHRFGPSAPSRLHLHSSIGMH